MTRLERLQQFLSEQPNDAFILFALSKEHEKLGNEALALEFYQKIEQTTPQYVGLYYHLGKLYERQNDREKALMTYKKGIEVARSERDFHALSELQGAKMNLGDYDDEDDDF
jgi:tetratricopeptide (TPR) repeat protein